MQSLRRTTSIIDIIIEAAIPVFIIGLIWSLVVFAITIKGVFYPGQERALSFVFFCYVVASVLINRIAGYYGDSEKAFFYSILLLSVMGLFALTFSSRYGSIVGGTNAGEGLWMNVIIISLIGFASFKISRESSFDIKETTKEKSAIQLKARLAAQRDWYRREEYEEEQQREKLAAEEEEEKRLSTPAKLPKKHPGIWIIYFSLFSMVVFAAGQRLLPEDSGELYGKAFGCLVANLVCALVLLTLITLSALRFHCWEKKTVIPAGAGAFWIATGGFLILFVLSIASVAPRPVPEYLVSSISSDYESMVIMEDNVEGGDRSKSFETWGTQSKLVEMKIEKEQRDVPRVMGELTSQFEGEEEETGGGEVEEEEEGRSFSGQSGSDEADSGKETSSGRSQRARSDRKGGRAAAQTRRAPLPTPPLQGFEKLGRIFIIALLILGLLWAVVMLLVAIGKTSPLKKLSNTFRNLAGTLRGLLKQRKKARVSGKKLQAALEAENLYMENPFESQSLLKQMSMAELVGYTYRAFENYAHAQGHTPLKGQTPIEFMRSLPEELGSPEFGALIKLFMLAEYSAHKIPDKNLNKLRQVWARMEA